MKSEDMILITADSDHTIDKDMINLNVLIEQIVTYAEEKLMANFRISFLRNTTGLENVLKCIKQKKEKFNKGINDEINNNSAT